MAHTASHLLCINQNLLDKETDMIPHGKDPIELTNIKLEDIKILLDFLNLGYAPLPVSLDVLLIVSSTRHNKKPLITLDWASVIAVCLVLGMQHVLNLSCKTLSDLHNNWLDISLPGAGFDRATYGLYFFIRENETAKYLTSSGYTNTEGSQLHIWPRQEGKNGKSQVPLSHSQLA